MMPLHQKILKRELADSDRFEFLAGAAVRKLVIRMDELHPSDDNDSHYLFLIWVKPDDNAEALRLIRQNLKNFADQSWETKILPHTGEGLIILSEVLTGR